MALDLSLSGCLSGMCVGSTVALHKVAPSGTPAAFARRRGRHLRRDDSSSDSDIDWEDAPIAVPAKRARWVPGSAQVSAAQMCALKCVDAGKHQNDVLATPPMRSGR